MRTLFEIDSLKYDDSWEVVYRPSCRAIIIKDNKIAMVYSSKYNYYKFPGGGIEGDEDHLSCLIRETKEEAGLVVLPESVKEFGCVRRIDVYNGNKKFVQDNYYYICSVKNCVVSQDLDDYENFEGFRLVWIDASIAINENRKLEHGPKCQVMIEREARVLELLINEGFLLNI